MTLHLPSAQTEPWYPGLQKHVLPLCVGWQKMIPTLQDISLLNGDLSQLSGQLASQPAGHKHFAVIVGS
jgi:hypothetical protein